MNLTDGGDGTSGYKHSKETLEKMCKIKSGENHTRFGKKHSDETKLKMSKSQKKRSPHSIETKEKMKVSTTGMKHSKESRK